MDESPVMMAFALGGIVLGVALFIRGLRAYRQDRLISSVATSSLDGLAAGEVRVSGVVEVADHALVSPLQSRPCVWYRARIETTGDDSTVLQEEERAVHFRLRDGGESIRVVPAGARWEIEPSFDATTSPLGDEPIGLQRRAGAASFATEPLASIPDDPAAMSDSERQAAIDALLTVRQPEAPPEPFGQASFLLTGTLRTGRRYRETRLEPGEAVTIVGQALPWSDVRDRLEAISMNHNVDHDIADDIAQARVGGSLAASADEAWGNAAIPGFGIGRPTKTPVLDAEARLPEVADPDAHRAALERYEIPNDDLVLARGSTGTFAVYKGSPVMATQHHDPAFALGLLGIALAASSALALGVMLSMSA
jgi:hypothetical protein